jgi:1D-myo-inositol 3-kinase
MSHDMESTIPVLVAGNYCHDTLINSKGRFEVLGGSASYISAVLSALKVDHSVIAKVGPDFKYAVQLAHPPLTVRDFPTTHFIDDFTSGTRVGSLLAECEAIYPGDLGTQRARIGLASGVAHELLPETLVRLKELSDVVSALPIPPSASSIAGWQTPPSWTS